jgi:hypothetical protein
LYHDIVVDYTIVVVVVVRCENNGGCAILILIIHRCWCRKDDWLLGSSILVLLRLITIITRIHP